MDKSTILIIDNTAENIQTLSAALTEKYKVTAAKSGEEALKILSGGELPDLILLDVVMPGLDGYEVCRVLKRDPLTKRIPVILLTAKGREIDKRLGYEVGASDYVVKPFSPSQLIDKVNSYLYSKK